MKPEPKKPAASKPPAVPAKTTPAPRPAPASPVAPKPVAKTAPAPVAEKVPPLFRRIDWLALILCFGIVQTIYLSTMAPEVTLKDSGELLTGSYYAGIPHPPGYPFWAIYSWLCTRLVPFGNVAWRVELGQAAAMGMGCSLIAFMVSRGSSMLIEGIEELKGMVGKWENAICVVCGVTAGLLMALDNSMWAESVAINRISEFGVPWLIIVLLCMMRWIYAPHQRIYLYIAFFFFGICATIHQTLIVAALGLEIGIAVTQPKLGRDLFFFNAVAWPIIPFLFTFSTPTTEGIYHVIGLGSLIACVWLTFRTVGLLTEWKACLLMAALWIAGASFYFYEAIAGMSNPPMEWGYPRTVEGFFHALTRGQYEKMNPSNIIANPGMFLVQLELLVKGVADAFNWVYMFFALLPFLFFFKMQRRERNWLIMVAAVYPFLGVLLTIFLNPQKDRQSVELLRVFFTASHTVVAIMIGYGLALTAAYMATHYEKFRRWGWIGGTLAALMACFCLWDATGKLFLGLAGEVSFSELPGRVAQAFAPGQYGLPVYAGLILLALPVIFLAALAIYRTRAPLLLVLALFALMPVTSGLSHWYTSEQRGHWFGYWFGHDMFTPPFKGPDGKLSYDANLRAQELKGTNASIIYPEMPRDTVVYGGTDPGRFCPTYMIFCESFIPHSCQPEQDQNFDRRDCYLITQNAVADPTYLDYIRAQYNDSTQYNPPFFQMLLPVKLPKYFHQPTEALKWLDTIFESIGAKIEERRRTGTSWFTEDQFKDAGKLGAALRSHAGQDELSKYLYGKLTKETQDLLGAQPDNHALAKALARDLNAMMREFMTHRDAEPTIYSPQRFANIKLPALIEKAAKDGFDMSTPNLRVRLNRRLLEEAYPDAIAKSLGGVYPDTEIQEPNATDSQQVYEEFNADAQRRLQHDHDHPEEPKQVRPDEVVVNESGQMQVSGQGAVFRINGLLTKMIFDRNPEHEFYVEESFPLDWMYPYLLPAGVIMKVNRTPVGEISEEAMNRDHQFWCDYSQRTIGDWITYDTSIKDICDFCDKIYVTHDYNGFKGDPKFVRDEDAQKSFSKLRNAIASSIYQWRMDNTEEARRNPAYRARLAKEAEFALKQTFAYCPYSPEGIFHLMDLLSRQGRWEDIHYVLATAQKLDPYNDTFQKWMEPVDHNVAAQKQQSFQQEMAQARSLLNAHKTNEAAAALDLVSQDIHADTAALVNISGMYSEAGNTAKGVAIMQKLLNANPNDWEMWFHLARIEAMDGKATESAAALERVFALNPSDRLTNGTQAQNLHDLVKHDNTFERVRATPEYQKVMK